MQGSRRQDFHWNKKMLINDFNNQLKQVVLFKQHINETDRNKANLILMAQIYWMHFLIYFDTKFDEPIGYLMQC